MSGSVPRRLLAAVAALAAALAWVVAGVPLKAAHADTIPANYFTVQDTGGVNDENGGSQVELTQFGRDDTSSSYYQLFWSWDSTDFTSQTGDACALFDKDGDGKVDFNVCGEIENGAGSTIVQTNISPNAHSCDDAWNDRCGNPVDKTFTSADLSAGPLSGSGSNLVTATDPFAGQTGAANSPNDSTLAVKVAKSFLPAGAELVNVCSYESIANGGNNNPNDCIANPGGGFISIVKDTTGGDGTFNFTLSPGSVSRSVTTSNGTGTALPVSIAIGSANVVTESAASGWLLDGASCTLEGGSATGTYSAANRQVSNVQVESGKITTCTFDNTVAAAGLQLTKTSDPASGSTVAPGTQIDYTLDYYNDGNVDVSGASVTDAIPAHTTLVANSISGKGTNDNGTITWTDLSAAAGTSAAHPAGSVSFSVTVDSDAPTDQTIDNTGHIAAQGVTGADSNTTHHHVALISAEKTSDPASGTADAPTTVHRSDPIVYTVTLTNPTDTDATADVTDSIPAHTTYVSDSASPAATLSAGTLSWDNVTVPAHDTASVSFNVTVDSAAANGDDIQNTAVVDGTDTNTTYHRVVVDQTPPPPPPPVTSPALHLAKTSVPASGSIVQLGDQIAYTINVTNTGDGAANGQTVTDTLPAGVSLVSGSATPAPTSVNGQTLTWTVNVPAASGGTAGSATITYSVTVNSDVAPGTTLTNAATVAGLTATTDHHVATGDLTLVKRVAESTAEYGDTLDYSFTATASGTADQHNVTVTDVVPDGTTYTDGSAACTDSGTCTTSYDAASRTVTWQLGDLAAGVSRELGFAVTVDVPDYDPAVGLPAKTIRNTGVVASDSVDSTPSNEVKTPLTAVLGVKVVRKPPTKPSVKPESHSRLPFTGSLPVWPVSTAALMLIGTGLVLTSLRRRRRS